MKTYGSSPQVLKEIDGLSNGVVPGPAQQAEDQPAAFAGVPHPGSQEWRPWDTISASDRMPPYFAISVLLLIALWQEREGPMLNSIGLPEHTQRNLLSFQAN
jgi:hypothetical protein